MPGMIFRGHSMRNSVITGKGVLGESTEIIHEEINVGVLWEISQKHMIQYNTWQARGRIEKDIPYDFFFLKDFKVD